MIVRLMSEAARAVASTIACTHSEWNRHWHMRGLALGAQLWYSSMGAALQGILANVAGKQNLLSPTRRVV